MSTGAELRAWLGPALDTMTPEQIDSALAAAEAIDRRWPDPDLADTRERALSAAVQVILGEDSGEEIIGRWLAARAVEREQQAAMTGAVIAIVGAGETVAALARRTGVSRPTLHKALRGRA